MTADFNEDEFLCQVLEYIQGKFQLPIKEELKKTFRKSRSIGFTSYEMQRMEDALLCSMANIYNGVQDPLGSSESDLIQERANSVYRKVCNGIARIMQPSQIQARSIAPRLQCHKVISSAEFYRNMAQEIAMDVENGARANRAALCIDNLHKVENDWLDSHLREDDEILHVCFDVMCFKKQKTKCKDKPCAKQNPNMTIMTLLSTLLFIKQKFKLCNYSCVCSCSDYMYIIAPTQDITIITKCLTPYLHLIIPLHKKDPHLNTFLSSPLIINMLSSAPPRSMFLKWSMFVLAALFHRKSDDPVDFMFDALVTNGCAMRAEVGRWRVLMLCKQYTDVQKLEELERDPFQQTTEDYVDYIPDDSILYHSHYPDEDSENDDEELSEVQIQKTKHIQKRIADYQKSLAEIMCRIKDMSIVADCDLQWTMSKDLLNIILTSGKMENDVPTVFYSLNNSLYGNEMRSIVSSVVVKKPHLTLYTSVKEDRESGADGICVLSENDSDHNSYSSDVSKSPRSDKPSSENSSVIVGHVDIDKTCIYFTTEQSSSDSAASDIESVMKGSDDLESGNSENSSSTASDYSISFSSTMIEDMILIPKDLSLIVLCEIAHHPEISTHLSTSNLCVRVPSYLDRVNVSEELVYERLRTRNFPNSVSKIARQEYRKLYSAKGAGSRSRPSSVTELRRIQNSFALMKTERDIPYDLHPATQDAIKNRWVHKTMCGQVSLDYEEQAFHLKINTCWESVERMLIEYEEVLRGFSPGSHNVHGSHDVVRVQINAKRLMYQKRKRIRRELHQRGGAHLWADKNIELCISKNTTPYEVFPVCADTTLKVASIQKLIDHDVLDIITAAYGHAVQPDKPIFPADEIRLELEKLIK